MKLQSDKIVLLKSEDLQISITKNNQKFILVKNSGKIFVRKQNVQTKFDVIKTIVEPSEFLTKSKEKVLENPRIDNFKICTDYMFYH